MKNALTIAKELLFNPASLDESGVEKLIRSMLNRHIDDADLYFQSVSCESWHLEDSEVKSGSFSIDKGVGVRAVSGDKTGYAYCDDILLPAMERAADAAGSIAISNSHSQLAVKIATPPIPRYQGINPIEGMSKPEKIALLEAIDKEARSIDPRVIQVNASLSGSYEVVMIVGLDGRIVADIRPLVSVSVSVIVEENGEPFILEINKGPDMIPKCEQDESLKRIVYEDTMRIGGVIGWKFRKNGFYIIHQHYL